MRVLILGASGMLGNTALRLFAGSRNCETWGTARATTVRQYLAPGVQERVVCGVDIEDIDGVTRVLLQVRPEVVINCVGLVKQHTLADDSAAAIQINALLPHRLAKLCQLANARLIHISTDCVFAGTRGKYREFDSADARDLYGRSKLLGEVDYPNAITLRTSIIGHELASVHGLIGWFLAQSGPIRGFTRAIFSGLPAVELTRVIRDYVLPRVELRGLYHVSAAPISKYELLRLVAQVYGKAIEIVPDDEPVIDRSLDSTRFRGLVGYDPPEWPDLVRTMHEFG
jgi:dTDP-4-dehydrorhamnose reductase